MIKESMVHINGHRTNIDHFRGLGYNIQFKLPCLVKVEHLLPGSTIRITSICDNCSNESSVSFRDYFESTIGLSENYYCRKCNSVKRKQTCIKKWGVENPMQSESIKQKLKDSLIEIYGVDHYSKTDDFKRKFKDTCLDKFKVDNPSKSVEIREKIKVSNLQNLGVEYPQQSEIVKMKTTQSFLRKWGKVRYSQTDECKTRIREISIEKWGVENFSQTDQHKEKSRLTSLKKWGVDHFSKTETFKNSIRSQRESLTKLKYDNLIGEDYTVEEYDNSKFKIKHKECDRSFFINRDNLYGRINLKVCICTECYPMDLGMSNMELEMQSFLNTLGICYIIKDKTILNGKELDIYIPELGVAIEMNGLYWHSEIYMDKTYHLDKTKKCKELGIDLIHVWEDDWKMKREIVQSIILNKLGLIEKKVFARKCSISEVWTSMASDFLDSNHIQGNCNSSVKLGLFYENELVSLMTFGFRYTNGKKEYELIRFCNKINLNVIGGASKLFSTFMKLYEDIDRIISYSDISIFNGKMYEKLGFQHVRTSEPNYFWVVDGIRRHRFNFNKKRLVKLGHDPNKTEVEILHDMGHYRVYSCGQEKWLYIK